jgi:hypothetical protein
MAVVINEFEMVPAPAETAPAGQPAEKAGATGPTPRDIERILERVTARARRVCAH